MRELKSLGEFYEPAAAERGVQLDRMIEVSRFPKLTFDSTAIVPIAQGQYGVTGTLTIRNAAKPVKILISSIQQNGQELHVQGSSEIHMKDFGLIPPAAAFGTIGTKEAMLVHFDLVAEH